MDHADIERRFARIDALLEEQRFYMNQVQKHLEAAAKAPLPWMLNEDKTTWTAVRPDGTPVSVERLDDGVSFLPRAGSAVGPVFDGVMAAATWAEEYPYANDPFARAIAEQIGR